MSQEQETKPKRVNRTLKCIVTGKEVIIKPDKYEKLLCRWGDDEQVTKNFICAEVERAIRDRDTGFWVDNSVELQDFRVKIRSILTDFNYSDDKQQAILKLQNDLNLVCSSLLSTEYEVIPSSDHKTIVEFRLHNVSFIGTIYVNL